MKAPKVMRPVFPKGYVERPKGLLAWEQVERRLAAAKTYWLCTVRPDGRPHAVPKWGVWVEGGFYFDGSAETRHARNLVQNPQVVVHLESGDDVVIVEGTCAPVGAPAPALAEAVADSCVRKYAEHGYAPEPDQWDEGGLYAVAPRKVLAWTRFTDDPTKFLFEEV
jgi:nitroimidazol reductase NimA-like FMN-containing flavoprotein (pyridoxamine 5'-phosphate oxidase superfamily)